MCTSLSEILGDGKGAPSKDNRLPAVMAMVKKTEK